MQDDSWSWLGKLFLHAAQIFIEPIGKHRFVGVLVGPAVRGAWLDDELRRGPSSGGLLHEALGLLEGHALVRIAMDDERRRHLRCDEVDRGDLFPELLAAFLSLGVRA